MNNPSGHLHNIYGLYTTNKNPVVEHAHFELGLHWLDNDRDMLHARSCIHCLWWVSLWKNSLWNLGIRQSPRANYHNWHLGRDQRWQIHCGSLSRVYFEKSHFNYRYSFQAVGWSLHYPQMVTYNRIAAGCGYVWVMCLAVSVVWVSTEVSFSGN